MDKQKILILDFGGQYNQLIARRVREQGVYCEVHPFDMGLEAIRAFAPIGVIFTGGPESVYAPESPHPDPEIYALGLPILGICYGCQLWPRPWGDRSPRLRRIPHESTARPRPSLTPAAPCSGVCRSGASPG